MRRLPCDRSYITLVQPLGLLALGEMDCQSEVLANTAEHDDEKLYESEADCDPQDRRQVFDEDEREDCQKTSGDDDMKAEEQIESSVAGSESSDDEEGPDGCQLDERGGVADGIMEEKGRSSAKRAAGTETLDTKLPSISPAKRFRYDIAGQTPFEVVPQLCLRGRRLKVPIVLPTLSEKDMRKIAGRASEHPFVRLANRDAWASSVCFGRVAGGKIMDKATKRVRQDLINAVIVTEQQQTAGCDGRCSRVS